MNATDCASTLARPFGVGVSDHSFVVERDGRRARVTVDTNSGMVSGVTVTAFGPALPEVVLSRESSFDTIGKSLRIAREAQLGDAAFDARVYIDTTLSDEQTRWLLVSPTARAAILSLLDTCGVIAFGEQGIATTVGDETIFIDNPPRLTEHLEQLFALYAALPAEAPALRVGQRSGSTSDSVIIAAAACALLGTFAFTAMLLVYGEAELFSPFALGLRGALLSLMVWAFVVVVATLFLAGRSSSFFRATMFALASAFVLTPTGPIVLVLVNEDLDTSPVRAHRMPITRGYIEEDDEGDTQLFLEFTSPVDPTERVVLGFAGDAVPPAGTVVHVKTRAGALGFPYRVDTYYGP